MTNHSALSGQYNLDPSYPAREHDQGRRVRKLWAAVLEEAYDCVCRRVAGPSGPNDRIREIELAHKWFKSDDTDLGSFLWVCELLGILPAEARATAMEETSLRQRNGRKYRRYRT